MAHRMRGQFELGELGYYHLKLRIRGAKKYAYKLGMTRAWLEARVIRPWMDGTPITLGGRACPPDEIVEMKIACTAEPADVVAGRLPRGWDPDSVAHHVIESGRDVTDDLITGPPGSAATRAAAPAAEAARPARVFVVHGRDLAARDAMYAFLRSIALEPIEWSVTATRKSAPYVGEVLDVLFGEAQAVVVLLTPDDEARLLPKFQKLDDAAFERDLTPQPRPNVLFEAGLAFGRHPDRTVLVELGPVRPFSDVVGRHAVRLGNDAASRKDLAERLQAAGCPVDLSGSYWLRAGDFDARSPIIIRP